MYAKTLALLAVSAFSLSAQAAPAASGSGSGSASGSAAQSPSATESLVTLPIPTQLGFPTGTVTLSDAVHWVEAHSDGIASYVGSSTLMDIQATLGVMDAQKSIGTATHLTAFIATDANSAPVVMVSSIGGSAITLATGTAAGGTTTFGGQVFRTAAPAVLAADSSSSGAAASSTMSMSMSSSASTSTSTSTGKSNGAAPGGVRVSRSAVAGALAVLGSVALGAVAVL
uniref:ATP-binding cassette sub-family A member 8-A n=1 Tax=Ganoderma boninense TaxID=34458 RepID=A0A5K1K5P2_9APHY|nr:ATP-binding cassette sub-family A member 8-A [Ganoderma boninense]